MTFIKIKGNNSGFTLVEMLFYSAGVVLLLAVITGMIYSAYTWYQMAIVVPRVDQVGLSIMSNIVSDIRAGKIINIGQSVFGNSNGVISLNTLPSDASKFYALQNGRIIYQENGGAVKYLSPIDVNVSKFYLSQITSPNSSAVRIDLEITYQTKNGTKINTYTDLAILKNSYQ
jgi:hypothetical protein